MAEVIVETAEGPKVRVTVGDDPAKHPEEIADALSKGKYEWMDKGGQMSTGQKIVRQAALPTIGGALGAAGGALLGGPGGAVGGEILGSMAGEAINQIWDPLQSGAEGSIAPVLLAGAGSAAMPAARTLIKGMAGAEAGLQLNFQRQIGPNGQRIIDVIAPAKGQAKALFEGLKGQPVFVSTARVGGKLKEVREELAHSDFPNNASRKLVSILDKMVSPEEGVVNYVALDRFRANMVDLGANLSALEAKGGPAYGRAKALYKAMWEDFEGTAGNLANKQLDQAIKAFKQELGADILSDYFKKASSYRQGVFNVDANSIMTRIVQDSDLLEKYFSKADIGDMIATLQQYGKVGNVTRGTFPQTPLQRNMSLITGADMFAAALSSRPGRQAVAFMAQHGLALDQAANVLAQASATALKPGLPGGAPDAPLVQPPGQ